MAGVAQNGTRLIRVTGGNLRNNHIYLTGLQGFFPPDVFEGLRGQPGKPITIELAGLAKNIRTDIPMDGRTGRPRRHFRARGWVREFFSHHRIAAGDVLSIERTGKRHYRLSAKQHGHGLRFAEFFAGIGLVRLGLESQGWTLAYANDIDPDKLEMYQAHFGDADQHFDLRDIHAVAPDDVPDVVLATASFPCTDLSLAGERRGLRGSQSSAFFGFLQIMKAMGERRPPVVLLENVLGFLTSHNGADFEHAMKGLNGIGYYVDAFFLDAKWFVPQSRPRLFVVASQVPNDRNGDSHRFAKPSRIRPHILLQYIHDHPGINWSLRALPEPPRVCPHTVSDILEVLPDDAPEWWSKERAEYLYNQMSEKHRAIAKEWMAAQKWSYGTVFRRVRRQLNGEKRSMAELRWDGLAGCLRTPKGGSGRQILFKAGYGRYAARLLTPRECARLMGADDFKITVSLNQALFGFGDAVCVPAVRWVAENYLNPLARELEPHSIRRDFVR